MARRRKSTNKERADSLLEMLEKQVEVGKTHISCNVVAPCLHPVSESLCVETPDSQGLWKCTICGKKWLR